MERRFKAGDLVWFWNWHPGSARSGLVLEVGSGSIQYLVARGDLGPEWIHGSQLWDRPEDVQPSFPSTRRVYPSMIAQEIVQVQPMPLNKSGLLFYLDEVEKRMKEEEGEK